MKKDGSYIFQHTVFKFESCLSLAEEDDEVSAALTSPPRTRASRKIVSDPNIQMVMIQDTTCTVKAALKTELPPQCRPYQTIQLY